MEAEEAVEFVAVLGFGGFEDARLEDKWSRDPNPMLWSNGDRGARPSSKRGEEAIFTPRCGGYALSDYLWLSVDVCREGRQPERKSFDPADANGSTQPEPNFRYSFGNPKILVHVNVRCAN